MLRFLRWFWVLLIMVACGWLFMGIMTSQFSLDESQIDLTQPADNSNPEVASGNPIQGFAKSVGIGFFICTSIPAFFFFSLMLWRTELSLRNRRRGGRTISTIHPLQE